jgi:hypothetical protein
MIAGSQSQSGQQPGQPGTNHHADSNQSPDNSPLAGQEWDTFHDLLLVQLCFHSIRDDSVLIWDRVAGWWMN